MHIRLLTHFLDYFINLLLMYSLINSVISLFLHLHLFFHGLGYLQGFLGGKESARNAVQSLGQEDPLEKGMATHSKVPWAKEPTYTLFIHSVNQSVSHLE